MEKTYPVVERFFLAVRHYIAENKIRGFKTFCDMYGLPRSVLARLEKEQHRHLHTDWLTLVVKLGYNAHWLLTGKGNMKE